MADSPSPDWQHDEWIWYFRVDLTSSVAHDVRPLTSTGGLFGVPRQFFPYIEYLSGLVFGPASQAKLSTTTHARDFLKQWMGRVDPQYANHADLLLEMWRHGLVHTYKPKVLAGPSGRTIVWSSFDEGRTLTKTHPVWGEITLTHLVPFINPHATVDVFPVSISGLVEDLENVLGVIATDLERERHAGRRTLLDSMTSAAQFLATPVTVQFTW